MNDRIQQLLERELTKFECLSAITLEPLGSRDIKSLDVLIKAYRTFSAPTQSSAVSPAADDPAKMDTQSLLDAITEDSKA